MKKLKPAYLLNLIAALAVMIAAPSCSDDTDLPAVSTDGDTVITLHVPNPSVAESSRSRAAGDDPAPSDDITTAEGAIKSLWLLAYDTKGSNHVVKQLQSSGEVSSGYTTYSIQFTPGSYRFYVVANIDSYIDKSVSAATAEDELKAMILRFSPEKLPNLADGLPMACLHDEIDEADADGIVTIAPGEKKQVHADMRFLCAKVRYTILFNNTNGGFSYDTFGDHSISFTGASATGVIASTTLLPAESSSTEGSFDLDKVPLESVDYVDETVTGAWQGTVYLPENLSTEKKSLTTLLLNATLDGSEAALRYTITLPSPEKVTSTEKPGSLQRGHFYDLTGRVTSLGDRLDLTAEVKDWTLLQLVYDIHGPYFLHVEKTEVKVQSGVETLIKYDTDAGELQFESDKLDDKDLFVFSTVTGEDGEKYISVNVNPEIPASYREVESYFYIKAANLRKRIEVKPARLNPFLNVTPTEIEINVREYISSGEYSAEIPISFTTNLDNVEISGFGAWDSSISLDGDKTTTEKTGTNNLLLTGMNGGDFWKSEHTLTLTYTATTGGTRIEETVTITVKPNILDYIIHFHAPTNWTTPHIYVYQCLQFPADLADYNGIPYSDRRSKPVGYDGDHAALEYAFTSKIAFKGWFGYGGPEINDPYGDGKYENSFFVFNGTSYNASLSDSDGRYHKNMDFSSDHRKKIEACSYCKDGNNDLYPGICMIDEGNGWWKYTLTGIATPGKALIMFGDGHTYKDVMNRYPGKDEVGIPLFDYPSREGWFDLANGATQFTSIKPKMTKYRIYWPNFNNKNAAYIHIWFANKDITIWGTTGILGSNSDYYYYDFELPESYPASTEINYQVRQAGDNANKKVTLDKFQKIDGEDIYAITLDYNDNLNNSGKPKEYGPEPALANDTYRIYWEKSKGWSYIWTWDCYNVNLQVSASNGFQGYTSNGVYKGTDGVLYNYFDFTATDNNNFSFRANFKREKGDEDWGNGSGEKLIQNSYFNNRRYYLL